MSDESPKIIIDEDWKSQVEREKQQGGLAPELSAEADTPNTLPLGDQDLGDQDMNMRTPPEASIEALVSMLFSQTLAALGQFPVEDGQEPVVDKPMAKFFIDTLELLGEKTKGNISDEETKLISDTLHGVRMAYVSIKAK